eukprot:TRINITY_DN4055_c1_g1_i1.p1 TRINITY_DN4055_c1_g1~~TRINITY_DN4055_c1_g1_i1.p1  ORF type:complete len:501 (+),score=92.64 TRINITY_DN4055_c1_g1_i1:107-1504(+)
MSAIEDNLLATITENRSIIRIGNVLELRVTNEFDWGWSSLSQKYPGQTRTFFIPKIREGEFVVNKNCAIIAAYDPATGHVTLADGKPLFGVVVRNISGIAEGEPNCPLAAPQSLKQMYMALPGIFDQGGFLYHPVPPKGYRTMGDIAAMAGSWDENGLLARFRCVRQDLTISAVGFPFKDSFWSTALVRESSLVVAWKLGAPTKVASANPEYTKVALCPGSWCADVPVGALNFDSTPNAIPISVFAMNFKGETKDSFKASVPEPDRAVAVETGSVALPWWAVNDPNRPDLQRFIDNVEYMLYRKETFVPIPKLDVSNMTSVPTQTPSLDETWEVVESKETSSSFSMALKLSTEEKVEGIFSASTEVSTSFTYSLAEKYEHRYSIHVCIPSIQVPSKKRIVVFDRKVEFVIKDQEGVPVGNIPKLTTASLVFAEYDLQDDGTTGAGTKINDVNYTTKDVAGGKKDN